MITHITVEGAAKLISWVSNMNKTEALIYISEAADRGEIQTATALSTLQAENENLRAELERVKVERDAYQAYFKDLSSKPDCNTCEKRNCEYRPKPGATVRANCPLYSGPEKDG